MPSVIHFEIQADDPQRAIDFYTSVLGWNFQKWDGPMPYWLIMTGEEETPGINGGLMERMYEHGGQEVNAFVCTVDVPNLDEYTGKVEKNGGRIVVPRMAVPGVGYMCYCKDTEDNIFGMMQEDPSAK